MATNIEILAELDKMNIRAESRDEKIDILIAGQDTNVQEHTDMKVILSASKERWDAQFIINKNLDDDIQTTDDRVDGLKTIDRVLGGLVVIGGGIATYFGFNK